MEPLAAGAIWAWTFEVRLIGAFLLLGGLFFAAFLVAARVARWARERPEPPSADAQLEEYRTLRDEGDLTPEEFERIRSRLEGRDPPA